MKPRCSELSHVMGLLGAVVLGLVGIARADIPGYEKSEFMVSMRDGVRLHTLVYRPVKQEGSLPIMLMRTPYGIAGGAPRSLDDYLKDLADEGYIFAFQDIRGRYKSEGVFVTIRPPRGTAEAKAIDEGTDAFDTIDWLVKNLKGNSGRVGMLGISYPGWLTVMALLEPHPALKAASPQAPPADMFLGDDFHNNGTFRLSYGFEYAAMIETLKENSHCFKNGHKIMVQIQSTWFPLIDRNPQTYVPNIFKTEARDFRPATQCVFRSPGHSSYIEMSIIGK
ncbi:MAG: CocE/NonD family hydrolase [Planctomycetaceae bacterium]|nr:CocE/NonD family hydrolase [Planctomycetaceae bacterium]